MIEVDAAQMVAALRRCSSQPHCDGCPYQEMLAPKCIQQMQHDAAAMIEGLSELVSSFSDT